jgi:hypothetical protein
MQKGNYTHQGKPYKGGYPILNQKHSRRHLALDEKIINAESNNFGASKVANKVGTKYPFNEGSRDMDFFHFTI